MLKFGKHRIQKINQDDPDDMRCFIRESCCVDESGCWIWQHSRNTSSKWQYGTQWWKGKLRSAHVLSYEFFKGPTNGLNVCHTCDNPRCCNPDHLWLGTQKQNITDAAAKGHMASPLKRGEKNGRCKLTDDAVANLRDDHASGRDTVFASLGRRYGCSAVHASLLVRNKSRIHNEN